MSKNVRADYGRKWSEMIGKTVSMLQTAQKVFPTVPKCPLQTDRCPNGLVTNSVNILWFVDTVFFNHLYVYRGHLPAASPLAFWFCTYVWPAMVIVSTF